MLHDFGRKSHLMFSLICLVSFIVVHVVPLPLEESFWLIGDNFLTSLCQLSDSFLSCFPVKIQVAVRGGVDNFRKANTEADYSASHSCILIGQLKRLTIIKLSKRCQKVDNLIKNFVQVATVRRTLL